MAYHLPDDMEAERPRAAPRVVERPDHAVAPPPAMETRHHRGVRSSEPVLAEIVPREDFAELPLFLRAGIGMLSPRVFGENLRHNIVAVYYGARLMRGMGAYVGAFALPLLLMALSMGVLLGSSWLTLARAELLAFVLILVHPFLYGMLTVMRSGRHVRRLLEALPLEELLLTKLKPIEMVQGMLAIIPAWMLPGMRLQVVVTYACLVAGAFLGAPTTGGERLLMGGASIAVAGVLSLMMTESVIHLAAAHAGRAHLFYARPLMADLRACLGMVLRLLTGVLLVGVLVLMLSVLGSLLLLFVVAGVLAFFVKSLLSDGFGSPLEEAVEAVAFAARWHLEWWPYQEDGSAEGQALRRTLFTPWMSLESRRRFVLRSARHE